MSNELPQAFQVPSFETLLAAYKAAALDYVAANDPDVTPALQEALDNDAELLAQITEAFVIKRQAEIREQNHQALQMFRRYVTDADMVELLALQYGLKRQTLKKGDASTFPPTPAVMESDESLLRRFDLAPYQFHTTGTRLGYKFHALTLDERPVITIDTTDNAVTMRYTFPGLTRPMPVKDAEARMLEAYSGKVCVAILSRENADGTASESLLQRAHAYLTRDDIAQESDQITVKTAVPVPYSIHVTVYTGADPTNSMTQAETIQAAQQFADAYHRLNTTIDREAVGAVFYELGAKRAKVHEPAADVICGWDEAPYCTEIVVDVRGQ